jgi:hypothetical protein
VKIIFGAILFWVLLINSAHSQTLLNRQADISLLVNINNLSTFYEFEYNEGIFVEKVRKGRVEKVAEGDRVIYKWGSSEFLEQYMSKAKKRKSIREKYRILFNVLSLDEYSVAAIINDRKYIAHTCNCDDKKILYVRNIQDKKVLFTIKPPKGVRIDDAELIYDSIVILSHDFRIGYWRPWELLPALAGHPISHNSFYLDFYSLEGNLIESTKMLEDITDASGFLIKK